jgi:hypothetical protein
MTLQPDRASRHSHYTQPYTHSSQSIPSEVSDIAIRVPEDGDSSAPSETQYSRRGTPTTTGDPQDLHAGPTRNQTPVVCQSLSSRFYHSPIHLDRVATILLNLWDLCQGLLAAAVPSTRCGRTTYIPFRMKPFENKDMTGLFKCACRQTIEVSY